MNHRKPYIIPKKLSKKIINECISLSSSVRVDQLDCSKSIVRQKTDKTVDEVLKIGFGSSKTLYHFIHREPICGDEECFDVGFSTMDTTPDYFLWIRLTPKDGLDVILKYKL